MTTIHSPLPEFDKSGGYIIQTSGYRTSSRPDHYGVDMGSTDGIEAGTNIGAVENGVICFQQPASAGAGAGHYTHLMGDSGYGWRMLHQMEDLIVPVGTRVKAGQIIGHVGTTGGVAAHLHIEKLRNVNSGSTNGWFTPGNTLDPWPDIQAAINARRFAGSSSDAPPKDWFDMATKEDLKNAVREVLSEDAVLAEIGKKVNYVTSGKARNEGQSWANSPGFQDCGTLTDVILDELNPQRDDNTPARVVMEKTYNNTMGKTAD